MDLRPPRTKTLWVKGDYLAHILAGRKTLEIRVGYANIRRLRPGDILLLNARYPYRIQRIALYPDFEALLSHESTEAIAPGLSSAELLAAARALYPPEKEALGVVALELTPAETVGGDERKA